MLIGDFVRECHTYLKSGRDDAVKALRYLTEERRLSASVIDQLQIGYCRRGQEVFGDTRRKAFSNRRLRGKVVVPIFSEFGAPVSVAGRSPLRSEKGWWNSSFDKNHHIFLFNLARKHIFASNKAYIHEGYMDAGVLFQHGLLNAVALMGTTLGYRRIGLLARYCDRVCLVFDNDENDAGLLAQLRSVADLGLLGFGEVSKIDLPKGVDPDEYVTRYGIEAYLSLERTLSRRDIADAAAKYERIRDEKHMEGTR